LVADLRSPVPLAFITACLVPPGGTYNYGHRRSQIGINIYARCPFLVIPTLFLSYVAFCLPSCTRYNIHTHWTQHHRFYHRKPLLRDWDFQTSNDNDVLPTTVAQRPSKLPTGKPPDANALTTRHIFHFQHTANMDTIVILEYIRKAPTESRRHLRQRYNPSQPIIDL
jgi:hypothetical protein